MAFRRITKEQLIQLLRELKERGWIQSLRPLNSGGIGNTIDSLLGFPENNLPIADTAQWELKTHRVGSSSLLTLFHMEPEPTGKSIVPQVLLPKYGWPHKRLPEELSFRQTLRATRATDRGFGITIDRQSDRVRVYFEASEVAERHAEWLRSVGERAGLGPLDPPVYWNFRELLRKASTKMLNTFYVEAETKRDARHEYFRISAAFVFEGFESERFLRALEEGVAFVDFDARTHKNHGVKFRLQQETLHSLYRYSDRVI